MMKRLKVKLPELHAKQEEIARACLTWRMVVIRCGRRFGKTILLERIAAKLACSGKLVGWFGPQYKLNTPTYNRLARMCAPQINRKSKIDQIIETKKGGSIEFWTLTDEDAGRSRYYDLAILDEASLVKGLKDIWDQAVRPTLLDLGGSAIMSGTPKGIDPDSFFYEACSKPELGWKEFHFKTADNPILNPDSVAKLQEENPPLVYQQEYLAEFVDWRGVAFFGIDSLLVNGQPVDVTWRGDQVFCTVDTASKDGAEHDATGVIYWLKSRFTGIPLIILDWDVVRIESSLLTNWIPGVNARCEELATELKTRMGSAGIWIEDASSGIMLNQAIPRMGIPSHPIDSKLTSIGKEGRAIAASPYVFQNKVKFSRYAFDKTKLFNGQNQNHCLRQICSFRMGQKKKEAASLDLLDCFTEGILISLGDADGY